MTTPPMATPSDAGPGLRERNKRKRADQILTAALELLREEPEQNLTVERIAKRAEVSPMTVFNLVGNKDQMWTALADLALADLDVGAIVAADPHLRARRIVDAIVAALQQDAAVFRTLLTHWRHGGRFLAADPTEALVACVQDAVTSGAVPPGVDARKLGEVMATGLLGAIHQWSSGLLSDKAFLTRARDVVDVAFDAGRSRR